jgi:hypothetical protein
MGIRRAKIVKKDQERKKEFRVDRCLDLHGPVENLAGDSCEGGFRGFHKLLRQKPSSLFIVLGWSSVSTTSSMMKSMYMDLVDRCP